MSFELTEQALALLKKRYFSSPDEDWPGLCRRVANALGQDDEEKERFFSTLVEAEFLPNSPTLMNAGIEGDQLTLSACFVLPIEDSIPGIFSALQNSALVNKAGGGIGINFSPLRPEGSTVGSTGGVSSGPISFLKIFDEAIGQLKQGGRRRGAGMALLSVDHPDIVKFIKCKDQQGEFSNFNISIAITNKFMEEQDEREWHADFGGIKYWILKTDDNPVISNTVDKRTVYTKKNIWDLICQQAHKNGEPGLFFIDRARQDNPDIAGVNVCGEQPLENYGVCVLGSIDLSKFYYDASGPHMNLEKLDKTIKTGVDFLNRVVDTGKFPLEEIRSKVAQDRNIGLGIMGWADLLLKFKIRYGSPESLDLAKYIMNIIKNTAVGYSKARGYNNKTLLSIAPTGSLSILAATSSGIEPVYRWVTEHNRPDFPKVLVSHPLAEEYIKHNFPMPDYFVTAHDICWEEHVLMQAAFQEYIDSGISKTINMPHDAIVADIEGAYKLAWEKGCKGITIYRDGSRENQVLCAAQDGPENHLEAPGDVQSENTMSTLHIREERPYRLPGHIFKLKMDMGGKVENVYVIVGISKDKPYEVFVAGNIKEADPIVAQQIDTTTRLVSLAMRAGAPLDLVVEQLEKVPCSYVYSIPAKVANVLREFLGKGGMDPCPECGGETIFQEGCIKCTCGWSRCN